MSLKREYVELAERLLGAFPAARVAGLHLPEPVPDETFRDEFGFVLLDDGSIGPFYVSMDDILRRLWARYPVPGEVALPAAQLLRGLAGDDLGERALALGTFNALSRALWREAGFEPPDRGGGSGVGEIAAGTTVGMVGYFAPLVDKLTAAGAYVRVLELAPQRVPDRPLVGVTSHPGDLAACARVLCTASALINDTLDELLAACGGGRAFELVGPSGSGLPDALFRRGVGRVGGTLFDDVALLREVLARGESWGKAGRKYQLAAADYPGVERLLAELR